jgi:hypothetical protein
MSNRIPKILFVLNSFSILLFKKAKTSQYVKTDFKNTLARARTRTAEAAVRGNQRQSRSSDLYRPWGINAAAALPAVRASTRRGPMEAPAGFSRSIPRKAYRTRLST